MRCLFLFSGGLDSILGVKLLQEQNIDIELLTFVSCFFDATQAQEAAQNLDMPLRVEDFSSEHLELVKNPPRGYGKNMNPCIDCHLMMMVKAKEIMDAEGFDFVATGEVVGERPMSQNRQMIDFMARKSGIGDKLLRPLSAKVLEPTAMEVEGKIDRDKLEDIAGRGRTRQLELVEKFGIKEFPTPAGGCALTDPGFSQRLRELFDKKPGCDFDDIELLKVGRNFWLGDNKLVIGRDRDENERIKELQQPNDYLFKIKNFPGPLGLLRGEAVDQEMIEKSAAAAAWYSTKARKEKKIEVLIWHEGGEKVIKIDPQRLTG